MERRELLAGASMWAVGTADVKFRPGDRVQRPGMPQLPALPVVSVRAFGAAGDGVQDDTLPLQEAIDAASLHGGGAVYVEAGQYLVGNVNLRQNVHIVGSGEGSVLQQQKNAAYLLTGNSVAAAGASGRLQNIGIRNLRLEGGVEEAGFAEHHHLLNLNGVANVLIESVTFHGFKGDGIYLGSGNTSGMERHNESVMIRLCLFDGVNRDNRNAVTIIDGKGIVIENNTMVRCTRDDMPGAIDVEPNRFPFHIIEDIAISGNMLSDIGGGVGAISIVVPQNQEAFERPVRGIAITGNTVENVRARGIDVRQSQNADIATSAGGVRVRDNLVRGAAMAMSVTGMRSIQIDGNEFEDCREGVAIGRRGDTGECADVWVRSNVFRRLGYDSRIARDGFGLGIHGGKRLWINENVFEDCGSQSNPVGVRFLTGARRPQTDNVWIQRNCFVQGMASDQRMVGVDVDSGHVVQMVSSQNAVVPRQP